MVAFILPALALAIAKSLIKFTLPSLLFLLHLYILHSSVVCYYTILIYIFVQNCVFTHLVNSEQRGSTILFSIVHALPMCFMVLSWYGSCDTVSLHVTYYLPVSYQSPHTLPPLSFELDNFFEYY